MNNEMTVNLLFNALHQSCTTTGIPLQAEIINGDVAVLQVLVRDREEFPIYITIDDCQILCVTHLWKEREILPEKREALLAGSLIERQISDINTDILVTGLTGEHPRIRKGQLPLSIDEFDARLQHHRNVVKPAFVRYQQRRQQLTEQQRELMRPQQYRTEPLSSFVRNRLINDVYLPIIGDNLAKQMGSAGSSKRTDLMGLLLLISPPGYGKTTLMEYIAHRQGLVFMKINCPALGQGGLFAGSGASLQRHRCSGTGKTQSGVGNG